MLGYSAEEVVNRITPAEISDPQELIARAEALSLEFCAPITPGFEALVYKAKRGIEDIYELTKIRKDGSRFPALVSVTALHDKENKIIGYLLIGTDNTARKLALKGQRESDEKFKYLFDHSPVGKSITLTTGEVQVNQAFCNMLGYSAKELKQGRWQDISPPEDVASTERAIAPLLAGVQLSTRFTKRYLHKDGSIIWADVSTALRRDAAGKPMYFMTSALDITELKRVEAEIRQLNAELEQRVAERTAKLEEANKELESFAYSVSHDLRTPLRAIDGFSHQLLNRYADKIDEEGKRYLNIVRQSAQKMGQLIDDILAFSRMGRTQMAKSEVDMDELVREVFEELKPVIADRNLTLDTKALPACHGDRAMLRQVWVNLLSNAIKFTAPRAAAQVEVSGSAEGAELIYSIKDNGAGFDMRYAEKLFGVFQRLHSNEEFEGTGIGLAIVKRIVTRHGGRVWAEGAVDQGATVYFALPRS